MPSIIELFSGTENSPLLRDSRGNTVTILFGHFLVLLYRYSYHNTTHDIINVYIITSKQKIWSIRVKCLLVFLSNPKFKVKLRRRSDYLHALQDVYVQISNIVNSFNYSSHVCLIEQLIIAQAIVQDNLEKQNNLKNARDDRNLREKNSENIRPRVLPSPFHDGEHCES